MRKFAAPREKEKRNQEESVPAASESLVAAKSAYKKTKMALDPVKLTSMTE
jgi:hypothetical protein